MANFWGRVEWTRGEPFLQNLCGEALNVANVPEFWPSGLNLGSIMEGFAALFSPAFSTEKCTRYEK